MLINLSDVLTSEGKTTTETVLLELKSLQTKMGTYQVIDKSPVALKLTNIESGKARVEGETTITFSTSCDRCLEEVSTVVTLSFDKEVTSPDYTVVDSQENLEMQEANAECMEGYQLDVETFVYNEILLNWPAKILCNADCKGICSICGKNLNQGECGCDTFIPDPRMAAINDIFNANKEV